MTGRPEWDSQFAEDEDERHERWRATRAKRKAEGKCWQCAKPIKECTCPNVKHEPEKTGMFVLHSCWKCNDGAGPCIVGNPRQCEYPHARND